MESASRSISTLDLVALGWFVSCWVGYALYAGRRTNRRGSLLAALDEWRESWARSITQRDNRIVDSQVINGLIHKETFFASTTILILAGLVALAGAVDEANMLARSIPLLEPAAAALWELKVGVLAVIFVYAFFKFSWAIRQHSYSAVVMVSLPEPGKGDPAVAHDQALRMASLGNLGARHFNDGIRAYYFALAALSWFLHPLVFIAATAWVLAVLYRREFHSKALALLASPPA